MPQNDHNLESDSKTLKWHPGLHRNMRPTKPDMTQNGVRMMPNLFLTDPIGSLRAVENYENPSRTFFLLTRSFFFHLSYLHRLTKRYPNSAQVCFGLASCVASFEDTWSPSIPVGAVTWMWFPSCSTESHELHQESMLVSGPQGLKQHSAIDSRLLTIGSWFSRRF